ncbi:hypothetical protein [Antrihabitans spumae]|uniref:Uncharacterized protein n=1 Tax=Antrihabitans spumae TaxID=3373370 RepID=A0ABW7KNG3_9NOCA
MADSEVHSSRVAADTVSNMIATVRSGSLVRGALGAEVCGAASTSTAVIGDEPIGAK